MSHLNHNSNKKRQDVSNVSHHLIKKQKQNRDHNAAAHNKPRLLRNNICIKFKPPANVSRDIL